MKNLLRLFQEFLRVPAPLPCTLVVEAVLIVVLYLSFVEYLPPSFPLAPVTLALIIGSLWRSHADMPWQMARLRHASKPLALRSQRRVLLTMGLLPVALLALSADARWAQRLLTFELAFATLPTALWLAAPGWRPIVSWRARLGGMQNRRAAQAFVSYGIAAILANEIAIRTFDEAGWVGFRAVVPLLLQSLVLTTLMLSDTDEDDA